MSNTSLSPLQPAARIYISGPIAHHDLKERKALFKSFYRKLKDLGYNPFNPFDNGVSDDAPYQAHMKADICMLLLCDYILMMEGWEHSKGCKLELDVASSCGIPVLFESTFFKKQKTNK